MKPFRTIAALAALAWCSSLPSAAETFAFNNINHPIPDGLATGLLDVQSIISAIPQVSTLRVTLNISGNFNGDLYVYLQHDSYTSILLNRPGRTAANPNGYADSGFQITLSDTAANDIHLYENSQIPPAHTPLTGLWQPDGRQTNPASVVATDPRTAGLAGFNGLDPSGTWKLFLADMSAGGTNTLVGWQLEVIPEPSAVAFMLIAGATALMLRKRALR